MRNKIKHGHSPKSGASRTYRIWAGMRSRCINHNTVAYKEYGGRGIAVCDRWLSFENFLADMGEAPETKSIDRIDNDKGYEQSNCRWASRADQQRNTRCNIWLEYIGRRQVIADWADELGMDRTTLRYRVVVAGWSAEKALTTPSRIKNKRKR